MPGALEIPLALQKMADTEQFDALIAIGAVIRGETYHFELVANESGAGITRVGLDFGIPIANAVLTTENDEQAEARMARKGRRRGAGGGRNGEPGDRAGRTGRRHRRRVNGAAPCCSP